MSRSNDPIVKKVGEGIYNLLLSPNLEVSLPGDRQRAQTTALALLGLTLAGGIWTTVSVEKALLSLFTFIAAVGYILSRTVLHRVAAAIAMAALCVPPYYSLIFSTDLLEPGLLLGRLAWLAAAIVLSGLILEPLQIATIAIANLAAILFLPQLRSEIRLTDLGPGLAFVIILTALMMEVMRQRARIEHDRRKEVIERERRLNEMSRLISGKLDLSEVLSSAVQIAAELVEAGAGMLALFSDHDHQRIEEVHVYNLPKSIETSFDPQPRGVGLSVAQSRQPVLINNYSQHPEADASVVSKGVAAFMAAPIIAGETVLGVISVFNGSSARAEQGSPFAGKQFEERDLEILEAVARQTAAAIQNARLFTALRQRDGILEAVASGARQFLQFANLPDNINMLLARLGRQTGSSHAYIYENHVGPAGERMCSQTYYWTHESDPRPLGASIFQNIRIDGRGLERWLEAMESGEPFFEVRSQMTPGEREAFCPLGAMSILSMPIYARAESEGGATGKLQWWGVIGFDDYRVERQWSEAEVDALKIVAGLLGAAIQRQRSDKAVQERETLYRRAITAAGAVPYYQDHTLDRYLFMGEGIHALTGFQAAELTPAAWRSLIQNQVMRGEAAGLKAAEAERMARSGKLHVWACDYRILTRDGQARWVADTAIQIIRADRVSQGWVGILQDITERVQAEEEVRALNAALETRVRERTVELEAANKELEAFAYSVSHDLRAPLRAIDGYSRMLLDDYGAVLDGDGSNFLNNVRQAAQNMSRLIDDLLRLSRVTRAELIRSHVDMNQLAEAILNDFSRQEPGRYVTIRLQPGMAGHGDHNLLKLVLENLLSNAWKFTRGAADACIEAGCIEQNGALVYYVRDNGAGFDMRYADKLFQPFQRLHSPREFEGTGVGLATVQRIIRRHGGRIWAEGVVDQGATFYFTLGE